MEKGEYALHIRFTERNNSLWCDAVMRQLGPIYCLRRRVGTRRKMLQRITLMLSFLVLFVWSQPKLPN